MATSLHFNGCFFLMSLYMLVAADPTWPGKRLAEWNERDAADVLANSPWVKRATPAMMGILTSDQRREGGNLGAGTSGQGGAGIESVQGMGIMSGQAPAAKAKAAQTREKALSRTVYEIRWESALPIRAAELRAHDTTAPVLEGDEYAIAIYDVSLKNALVEMKKLDDTLKHGAFLKIEGKKDMHPSRVAIIENGSGEATLVYLFPRNGKITLEDKRVDFSAQIGRFFLAQSFYPQLMVFQGKLEL
jgi:hypothetical protein